MNLIQFPFERVIEINAFILEHEPGMKGSVDLAKLQSALGRIAHALPDANKRTGLAVALEYLSLNDYELVLDNDLLADAIRDLVIKEIGDQDFADLLYAQYMQEQDQL